MSSPALTPFQDKLPQSGPGREALRERGQFWTPDWVAQAMVSFVTANGSDHIFDPAVGAGAFFRAAKTIARESGIIGDFTLLGTEIDPDALAAARQAGLQERDLANVQMADFVLNPPNPPHRHFKAIVANPPYVRHHRLTSDLKAELKELSERAIGVALDGRAGLHIYFLIRALQLLEAGGRLAFIMPADTCEGLFARPLWHWIASNYRLEAVVAFAPNASPFPKIDTNPLIFMITKAAPTSEFFWIKCNAAGTGELQKWVTSDMRCQDYEELIIYRRQLAEGLKTGLSRFDTYPVQMELELE